MSVNVFLDSIMCVHKEVILRKMFVSRREYSENRGIDTSYFILFGLGKGNNRGKIKAWSQRLHIFCFLMTLPSSTSFLRIKFSSNYNNDSLFGHMGHWLRSFYSCRYQILHMLITFHMVFKIAF